MKKISFILLILLIIPSILAIDLDIEKTSSDETMIIGLERPTVFDLEVTNNGTGDNFFFYTFFGGNSYPTEKINIAQDETKTVQFGIYPREDLSQGGAVTFKLFIQGLDKSEQEFPLLIKIIDLKDAFSVGSGEFSPESNSLQIYFKNEVNFGFENIEIEFKSPFFNFDETLSIAPYERKTFDVQLNKEDFNEIMAGFYTLQAEMIIGKSQATTEGVMKFSEKDILETTQEDYGFIIRTNIIKKSNEGNTITESETVIKKNIVTRLFTTLSPSPDIAERQGFKVYYTWNREIKPGETLEIKIRTNWLLPLLVIFLIVAIVVLTKKFSKTDLALRKRVSFVRAKGGEFALKVSLVVSARKYIERVSIIDRLPPLVKIHERFGVEKPTRVDEKTRRIGWDFEKLEAGEVRTLSYIIYSKVGVLGKFALPTATAIYEKEGEIREAESNKTFFIAEQSRGKEKIE